MNKENKKAKPEINSKRLKEHFDQSLADSANACSCGGGLMERTYQKVQDLEGSIEIIAREIGRRSNSKK